MAEQTNAGSLDFIYFSSIDWNFTWQRPQQLAHRLSRYGKLIYVNPLGLRSVVLKDAGRIASRIAFSFSRQKTVTLDQSLRIYTPLLYLPFPESPLASRINGHILSQALTQWMRRLDIQSPIAWVGIPSLSIVDAIARLSPRLLVYDCLDNFPLFHRNPYHIIEAEQQLASQANVVFATATELYDRMRLINPRSHLIPNAADYEHFAHAAIRGLKPPTEMARLRKPILGYMGEMAQWFDFDLVYNMAVQHPDWSIVLIGLVHVDPTHKVFRLPNVHHLGRKDYSVLPAYVNQFDVCLLPFKINALTSAVNPVKLYEYLAAGKPVVSTPMREVLQYQDIVEIADRSDFPAAVKKALETDSEAKVQQRMEVARQNTWDQRVEKIIRILTSVS